MLVSDLAHEIGKTGSDLTPPQANFISGSRRQSGAVLAAQRADPSGKAICLTAGGCAPYRLEVMFNPGFTAPLLAPCPSVTTFHDLQHKRHPEHFRWFDLPFWRFLLWAAAHRSRRLIAVSEATCADLSRFYHLPKERVDVIPHGVKSQFFELDRSRIEPYFLCVSTLHPHKNLERLIRAYARQKREQRAQCPSRHARFFRRRRLERIIRDLEIGRFSQGWTGWLPRDELLRLFQRAYAFVYPSAFEGFGIPVLEALAAGIPVACSDIPPLREVAGEAALMFDPLDEDSIGQALHRTSPPTTRCVPAWPGLDLE